MLPLMLVAVWSGSKFILLYISMPNLHIICRCIGLVVVRVRVRVTFCIHKLTLVLHFATKSHCSNNLCSLCARHAVCATGKARNGGKLAMGTNFQS